MGEKGHVIRLCAKLVPIWPQAFLPAMQHFGKAALRVTKNYTKGYSDTQSKVRDATSNDPWGPSGTQMNDIAQMTYNQSVAPNRCTPTANIYARPQE